ncbi:MAG TPA: methyltransferase domain-containing protein [Saprospiraceae bacterium]|nr:methyltransferase domain-containing protein [Saprospiraceae bacterium]HMP23304.1 methyltransferase domain-containing protein [Saprospiraceae bacterium]
MNYKLLFPTYRNRYRFVQQTLQRFGPFEQGLSLGSGEGDYDAMIATHCRRLVACDINAADVAFAKTLNQKVENLDYQVENALELSFADHTFQMLVSVEVIEHVGHPEQMVREMARVLAPGGIGIITFPSKDFPFTYDPVNRLNGGERRMAQGAYAFGHEYLISPADFRQWLRTYNLAILQERNLSGYLVGLLEMYWTGWIQRLFKANAGNVSGQEKVRKAALRPTNKAPWLVVITDSILALDRLWFGKSRYAVGKGFVVEKIAAERGDGKAGLHGE